MESDKERIIGGGEEKRREEKRREEKRREEKRREPVNRIEAIGRTVPVFGRVHDHARKEGNFFAEP